MLSASRGRRTGGDRPRSPRARGRPRGGEAIGGPARLQQRLRHCSRRRSARGRRTGARRKGSRYARKLGNRQWERALARRSTPRSRSACGTTRSSGPPSSPTSSSPCEARSVRHAVLALSPSTPIAESSPTQSGRSRTSPSSKPRRTFRSGQAYSAASAMCLLRGRRVRRSALRLAEERLELRGDVVGLGAEYMKELFVVALDAAFALNDLDAGRERVLGDRRGAPAGPFVPGSPGAGVALRARLAAERGETDEADAAFQAGCRTVPRARDALLPRGHAARARGMAGRDRGAPERPSRCSPRRARCSTACGRVRGWNVATP